MTTGIDTHTLLNMPTLGSVQETLGNLPEGTGGRKIAVTYPDKPVSTESIVQHFKNDVRNLYQWVITTASPMTKTLVEVAESASTTAQKTLTSVQGALKPAANLLEEGLSSVGSVTVGFLTFTGNEVSRFSLTAGNAIKSAAPYVGTAARPVIQGLAMFAPIAIPLRNRAVSSANLKKELKRSEDANLRIKNDLLFGQDSTEEKLDLAKRRAKRLGDKKQHFTELKDRKIISFPGFMKCLATVAVPAIFAGSGPAGMAAGFVGLAVRGYVNRQEACANEAMAKKYEKQEAEFEKIANHFGQQLEEQEQDQEQNKEKLESVMDHADGLQSDLTELQVKYHQDFEGFDKWSNDLQTQFTKEQIKYSETIQKLMEENAKIKEELKKNPSQSRRANKATD